MAIHLLEPAGPDSFVYWGFFNSVFEQKEGGEGYVVEKLAREMLAKDPALQDEFNRRLLDPAFARNPRTRLNFFYERSPYFLNQKVGVYPVGRITTKLDAASATTRLASSPAKVAGVGDKSELESTKWTVTAIGNAPVKLKGEQPFIQFDKDKGSYGGSTGCNRIFGKYALDGDKLKFGDVGMTMIACSEETGDVEARMSAALGKVDRYAIKDGILSLYAGTELLLKMTSQGE